jgi:ATP/ADP translocase
MCIPPQSTETMTSTTTTVETIRSTTATNPSNRVMTITLKPRFIGYCRWAEPDLRGDHHSSQRFARIQSILFMATASALHFAGFEFARSGTIALFTSTKTGFSSPSASPLSTICMTPFSIVVLWLYTKSLDRWGPRNCLILSTVLFAFLLASSAVTLNMLETLIHHSNNNIVLVWRRMAQATIFSLNVAQSSFVQLLYTQHWSFIGSVSKELEDATVWFAPIAGLGSIASTLAALGVPFVVQQSGLTGSLGVSSLLILVSGIASDLAYRLAHLHRFEPNENNDKEKHRTRRRIAKNSNSLIETSINLFTRVPVLVNLCMEVLTCQSVSFIINFLFLLKVKQCISDDQHRASWTARWYARINFFSGVLQFGILPWLMNRWRMKHNNSDKQHKVWLLMPLSMMVCATLMTYQTEKLSLLMVTVSFALHKVLEYSVRGVAVEMVYVNLDYESRFFGKEIIGLFVDRLGKASTAVILSSVSYFVGNSAILEKIFVQALSAASLLWLFASYPLANPPRKEKLQ